MLFRQLREFFELLRLGILCQPGELLFDFAELGRFIFHFAARTYVASPSSPSGQNGIRPKPPWAPFAPADLSVILFGSTFRGPGGLIS